MSDQDKKKPTFKDLYYSNYDVLGVPQDLIRSVFGKQPYNEFNKVDGKWVSDMGGKPGKTQKGVTVKSGSAGQARAFEEKQANQARVDEFMKKFGDFFNTGSEPTLDTPGSAVQGNPLSVLASFFANGGSGGGSSASRLADIKAQNATRAASGILDMINSGSYKLPYVAMSGTLADYLSNAQSGIQGAYGDAAHAVQQAYATNPYAGMTGTNTVADSGLQGLLTSQGASNAPLEQMIAANREAASGRANAFTDLAKMLGAGYQAAGNQAQADVGAMQAGSLQDLLSQGAGYQAAITSQQAAALKALQDQLMSAGQQGADLASLVKRKKKG